MSELHGKKTQHKDLYLRHPYWQASNVSEDKDFDFFCQFNPGYANESCEYDAKKGIGIGDTVNSYGFDGARRKIWSGPTCDVIVDNDYGV